MTKARINLSAITLFLTLFLTGCWDIKSIEDLTIPIASGYEIVNGPDSGVKLMNVYTVYPVFYKNAPRKSVVDVIQSGYIGETRTMRQEHIGGKLNLGGIQVAVIGRELAQEGIRNALNIILRTAQLKSTIAIAMAEGNINDIFYAVPDNYPNVGIYMKTLLADAYKQSFILKSDLHHVSVAMDTPGWHPVIPMLKAEGNEIMINGYGIFREDKLAHTITITEARVLNILSGMKNIGERTFPITCNGNIPCTATVKMQNEAKIKVARNGESYRIDVSVKSKGTLDDLVPNVNYHTIDNALSDKENLLKNERIEEIGKGYEELLKKEAEALIDKAQNEFKMDIFNWIKYAQAKWRKDIDRINWDDCFSGMDISVNIKATIEYIGEET
ncbi:MAG: Ger(x)C family spore germination protein [Clostridiaceae bacterium]